MTSIAVKCCAVPLTEWNLCLSQPEREEFEWSHTDLNIQSFIRHASGGIEAGSDRILVG